MCREHYPELYERIRRAAKDGRWIAEGAMYVEPDTNMPSGEALVRQLVYGKRFYREQFGVESRMLWLPDTFGYSAVLPQLLRDCGVEYLVTQKIFWSYNEGDPFPYHYFTWKGMDGSAVTSFLPTSYTYRTDPKELCGAWRTRAQKRHLDEFMVPFGYGDGGGGPCRDFIEYAMRERDLEGMPRVEMMSPLDFFADLEKKGTPEHTWDGELYFNAHRGTCLLYTSEHGRSVRTGGDSIGFAAYLTRSQNILGNITHVERAVGDIAVQLGKHAVFSILGEVGVVHLEYIRSLTARNLCGELRPVTGPVGVIHHDVDIRIQLLKLFDELNGQVVTGLTAPP